MECITYELKYCERCGALRLRRSQSSESYCGDCEKLRINHPSAAENGRRPSTRTLENRTAPLLNLESQRESNLPGGRLQ